MEGSRSKICQALTKNQTFKGRKNQTTIPRYIGDSPPYQNYRQIEMLGYIVPIKTHNTLSENIMIIVNQWEPFLTVLCMCK